MTPPTQQPKRQPASAVRRVIVLPDVGDEATLAREFGQQLPIETIERAIAAARHALERSHQPVTTESVNRLARDQLRTRVAALTARRR